MPLFTVPRPSGSIRRALHRARLHDPFAPRAYTIFGALDIDAGGLFNVDILARFTGFVSSCRRAKWSGVEMQTASRVLSAMISQIGLARLISSASCGRASAFEMRLMVSQSAAGCISGTCMAYPKVLGARGFSPINRRPHGHWRTRPVKSEVVTAIALAKHFDGYQFCTEVVGPWRYGCLNGIVRMCSPQMRRSGNARRNGGARLVHSGRGLVRK